ncbi:MAG: AAA family ATPase [Colwellia sp.]|nr:AAA family ATPase [Colwellia sp.]
MIKNILTLKNFGIFQNHSNKGINDFSKYNLFYGWNGSGKSTLSSLFRCIENNTSSERFPSAEFSIKLNDGSTITQANINEPKLNICTFNHDFIEENISWNNVVKSILLVDKEKIAEREKLEQLKSQQQSDTDAYNEEIQSIKKLESEMSKFGTASAKRMKTSLQSIDTTDSYYLNYNKTKFEQCISQNIEKTKSDIPLLNEKKIIELTNAAKPDQKSPITFYQQTINEQTFTKAKERLNDLLKTSVVSQTIQRLVEHGDIKTWVESGLDLHKCNETKQCEFCGNEITIDRINMLEAHFNDDYKAFQDRLTKADLWLSGQYIQQPILPLESEFYNEFKTEHVQACSKLGQAITNLNNEVTVWHEILKQKIKNPLETGLEVNPISKVSIIAFNDDMIDIGTAVDKNNHKSSNFKTETTKAKKRLELHFATAEVIDFSYHDKQHQVVDRTSKNNKLNVTRNNRETEIRTLENSLSNEGLGADQFNESLHKFIGRSELTLRFNSQKKGYEILRNNSESVQGNLSEGEKTAIAFVYFITKLKEKDNNIEDTIVVIDDPISSFDSNHLFHAYSFLRTSCDLAKQVFILTHNFTYFKLVRDWFDGKNRNRSRKGKSANAFFFTIESSTSLPRCSTIKNADTSLVNYNSEYHYIFSKLHSYKDSEKLSRDDAFLTANLSRKLLESFFSFKFPRHRTDIAQLMDCGLKGCQITDQIKKEKIYRFINKYSHSAVIEVNEDSSENLLGESHNVIGDIFTWIKEVDEVHFDEMLQVISS